MNFAWAKPATVVAAIAALALGASACGRSERAPSIDDEAAIKAAQEFLIENGTKDGVKTLPSGLQYKVIASGPATGVQPDSNDLVRVHYEGTLTDGTVFDSSFDRGTPAIFAPEQVVPGWTEALQLMRPGDEWFLYVPPALGYGESQAGPIPPHSVLVFRLKVLDVAPVPGGHKGGPAVNG
ncbi:peptidylprolyl isomerase [Brevundimonas sp. GN22]|uniref:FKBP-type peptidyl-prolyl cis-trans isomerase n=1 Tax=Brevundimonas pishanensis TaxID=2896315 RepID=UPI001FA6EA6F|nr:FKBP-type peptidyl-prolyl cis-trans isomerase [Brevundimonas pishanensis]